MSKRHRRLLPFGSDPVFAPVGVFPFLSSDDCLVSIDVAPGAFEPLERPIVHPRGRGATILWRPLGDVTVGVFDRPDPRATLVHPPEAPR